MEWGCNRAVPVSPMQVGAQADADFSEAKVPTWQVLKFDCRGAQRPHGDRGSHLQLALLRGHTWKGPST